MAALILGLKLLKPLALPAGTAALSAAAVAAGHAASRRRCPSCRTRRTASTQLRSRIQADSADRPNTAAQVMRAWLAES